MNILGDKLRERIGEIQRRGGGKFE